ncbi:MAG TPA: hypothetical protein VJY62_20110 [Bacteroidia bacterium]|nr:hypothetical protein [Bacteroidia bacterium]
MKNTLLILCLVITIVYANVLFTTSGCSSEPPGSSGESITNKYAIMPTDLAALTQKDADLFSWQTFIAMNWPADINNCGPDTGKGMSILSGKGPVVWETYLSSDEVFVAASDTPDNWCTNGNRRNGFKRLPQKVQDLAKQTAVYRFIYRNSKSPHDLDEAVGGPLVDQNGRFARYEVRMNEDEYKYIMTNSLWDKIGQQKFVKDCTITMPSGPTSYGPVGAMEFKAAWKVLGKGDDTTRFYRIRAIVYNDDSEDPSPGENPVTLGLVGLHIAHKTPTQGNWVWSTFEQVDNLTKSFYNPACTDCPANVPLTGSNFKELDSTGMPLDSPTQVTRINPIQDPFADTLNQQFQSLLKGSVWANYQLVSTQWLAFEKMTPLFLANSVQETYVQGPNPPSYGGYKLRIDQQYYEDSLYHPFAPGISASCMGCHYVAGISGTKAKADFSFMLGEAK